MYLLYKQATLFVIYWVLLGYMVEIFNPIESATFELFYPNLRDLRYFYLLPYFLSRFSLLVPLIFVALVVISLPLLSILFPFLSIFTSSSHLISTGSLEEIARDMADFSHNSLVLDLLLLSIIISCITYILVTMMGRYNHQSFLLLVVCLLTTTLISYASWLSFYGLLIVLFMVLFVESAQTLLLKERSFLINPFINTVDSLNSRKSAEDFSFICNSQTNSLFSKGNFSNIEKARFVIKEVIPFSILLPFILVIIFRLIFSTLSNWLFIFGLFVVLYLLLSLKVNQESPFVLNHNSITFYMLRSWLFKNIALVIFCFLFVLKAVPDLMLVDRTMDSSMLMINLFLSWVLLRLLIRLKPIK